MIHNSALFFTGQKTKDVVWFNIYKMGLLVWIMFGLGYLVMILGFISRAMRCKKMARLEQKLVHKVWNEFTRDFTYLRRMLNEMYLLKFKVSSPAIDYTRRCYLMARTKRNTPPSIGRVNRERVFER